MRGVPFVVLASHARDVIITDHTAFQVLFTLVNCSGLIFDGDI